MNQIEDEQPKVSPEQAPLALHIARLRQWYGERGIGQSELAKIAGVSVRLVRKYEACRVLPPSVDVLFRLAFALQKPIEDVIDRRLLAEIGEGIARRRETLDEQSELEPNRPCDSEDEQ